MNGVCIIASTAGGRHHNKPWSSTSASSSHDADVRVMNDNPAASTRYVRHRNKVPVILQRYHREKTLPVLERTKFLVNDTQTLHEFLAYIR